MTTQALAVLGLITRLEPIVGADRILQAHVFCGDAGTWSGVVGLDIQRGQHVIVFLQDAILPPDPRWAFMEKHHWRVSMARFKGVPSECVIVPAVDPVDDMKFDAHPGADLTAELGVTKHSKPIPAGQAGLPRGNFPSFIPKTDEPNFQRLPGELLDELFRGAWVASLKCDGTSCTAWNDIVTGELRKLIPDLLTALGGEVKSDAPL